jgi:hypothetical protein
MQAALVWVVAALMTAAVSACGDTDSAGAPTPQPGATTATVRIVFLGATTRRGDLPASAQACVTGVGATHIHPSWRSFAGIALQPVPPDRYELTFTDVPVNTRVSFRINDQTPATKPDRRGHAQRPDERRSLPAERHHAWQRR